jgi:hypothetical protein
VIDVVFAHLESTQPFLTITVDQHWPISFPITVTSNWPTGFSARLALLRENENAGPLLRTKRPAVRLRNGGPGRPIPMMSWATSATEIRMSIRAGSFPPRAGSNDERQRHADARLI